MPEPSKIDGYYIFRASIKIKGMIYYARDYGLKAFRIFIRK